MKRFVFCVLVVGLLIAPRAANALTCLSSCTNTFNYQFVFSDPDPSVNLTLTLSGQLTTANTPDPTAPVAAPGYDVISATGTSTFTGSAPTSTSLVALGVLSFPYDNILYFPAADMGNKVFGYFDFSGIVLLDSAGIYYNIYTDSTGDPVLFGNTELQTWNLKSDSVSPVPEASTWIMVLIGLAGLGLMAHRQKRRAVHSLV
jgi:hypothetical protein